MAEEEKRFMERIDRPLIKPEPFDLLDKDNKAKTFILSNFDAISGREIITQYPLTGMPKLGDYASNEKLMRRLMCFVAVVTNDGRELRLTTEALVLNHVDDTEMLMAIEMKMMEKNFSFFRDGRFLLSLDGIVQMFGKKILEILTQSSESLSQQEKQPTTN